FLDGLADKTPLLDGRAGVAVLKQERDALQLQHNPGRQLRDKLILGSRIIAGQTTKALVALPAVVVPPDEVCVLPRLHPRDNGGGAEADAEIVAQAEDHVRVLPIQRREDLFQGYPVAVDIREDRYPRHGTAPR